MLALRALGQSTRPEAFELVRKSKPDGLPAGGVARPLDISQNTMPAYPATLYRVGLVSAERHGRNIVYRVEPNQRSALAMFLGQDYATERTAPPRTDRDSTAR